MNSQSINRHFTNAVDWSNKQRVLSSINFGNRKNSWVTWQMYNPESIHSIPRATWPQEYRDCLRWITFRLTGAWLYWYYYHNYMGQSHVINGKDYHQFSFKKKKFAGNFYFSSFNPTQSISPQYFKLAELFGLKVMKACHETEVLFCEWVYFLQKDSQKRKFSFSIQRTFSLVSCHSLNIYGIPFHFNTKEISLQISSQKEIITYGFFSEK